MLLRGPILEGHLPLRLVDGELETGVRVVQEPLRGARVGTYVVGAAAHGLPENRLDRFCSQGDERAAQTELHVPAAATELRGDLLRQLTLLPVGHEDDRGARSRDVVIAGNAPPSLIFDSVCKARLRA